jgi:acid phosphatase
MEQHRLLGSFYRSYLVTRLNFLPAELNPHFLYVRASFAERTFRSATSFLHGLYQPQSADEILDIQTGTRQLDILRMSSKPCRKPAVIPSNESHNSEALMAKLYGLWYPVRSLLEVNEWNAQSLDRLCDWIVAMHCNERTIANAVNQSHFDACLNWQRTRLARVNVDGYGAGFARGMREMLTLVRKFRDGETKQRFVLLSGHDSTIIACLGLLGHAVDANPPLASHLAMEVMEDSERTPAVRWIFNGKVLKLPEFEGKEIVRLDVFVEKMLTRIHRLCPEVPID